jgi:hypothetical protein
MSEHPLDEAEEPIGQGLDRSRIDETFTQDFNPSPMHFGPGADGLATPQLHNHLPLAPPLSLETFVCLGDESEFVLRSPRWGDVVGRFTPEVVETSPSGEHYVSIERAIESGAPWLSVLRATDPLTLRVRVEPIRPQCSFLAQQMADFGDESSHQILERLCTARRDDHSFFMGLRDTRVYACELREPRDRQSEERVRIMNNTKIILGKERLSETGEKPFDVDAALREAEKQAEEEGLTATGIFKGQ